MSTFCVMLSLAVHEVWIYKEKPLITLVVDAVTILVLGSNKQNSIPSDQAVDNLLQDIGSEKVKANEKNMLDCQSHKAQNATILR